MAKLTTKARKALPKSDFGLPGKKAYPMPDRAHAANAKARASQAVNAGRMSKSTESKIDAKANKVIGKGKSSVKRPGKLSVDQAAKVIQANRVEKRGK